MIQGQAQSQVNQIGLDADKIEEIAASLNDILASYHVSYQNLRGFHWNVKGHQFFELHEKFEQLYEEAKDNIDALAERILTLGFTPYHTMSDFLEVSGMKEAKNVFDDKEIVKLMVKDFQTLVEKLRSGWQKADDASDVGTTHLLEDFIGSHEKTIWMLNSWLNRQTGNITA
jgi:starvation-inducible DNA-binding protein